MRETWTVPLWVRDLWGGLLALLYPFQCPLCRAILPEDHPLGFCPPCLLELPGDPEQGNDETLPVLSATPYTGAPQRLVRRLKYEAQPWVGRSMGRLMARRWETRESPWRPDAVIPVPLHPSRKRWRGYNQSEILASELARQLGIPFRTDLLSRARVTPSQVGLPQGKRLENVLGAFRAAEGAAGLRILVVDDVMTTGATLSACSAALAKAKARGVKGYTWARGVLRGYPSS